MMIAPLATDPGLAQNLDSEAATLAPGKYAWNQDAGAEGPISIVVSLPRQLAYVYRGGTLIGVSTVSTGRDGYPTPTGTFTILQKAAMHKSNRYNDAPMPWMQRLTWDGVALHSGSVPGYHSSHGCVHLPDAFARELYGITRVGATVTITDDDGSGAVDDISAPPVDDSAEATPDAGLRVASAR
ncbi:MAG: L,D-transpeptidase family protein [Sphingomonadaceae bacterium]|nr:L,D-transpeptidase family protein [Sphingomonadaceae bacterium]